MFEFFRFWVLSCGWVLFFCYRLVCVDEIVRFLFVCWGLSAMRSKKKKRTFELLFCFILGNRKSRSFIMKINMMFSEFKFFAY